MRREPLDLADIRSRLFGHIDAVILDDILALIAEVRRLCRRPRVPARLKRIAELRKMAEDYMAQPIHANFDDGKTFARAILSYAPPKKGGKR